ncbi:peptidase P60 [Phyllobacterium sp. 628]|uniref:NlpC/P60 family protein n=1 Tax=Phyllobacterium sp. 628 TaxID=2718938 RepID=UPI0016623588|nr:NlpC/P60 family protein [Phyllobacterium sp. 628]QND52403.1 peptidase P60 [Phyllobacterium sp. 628]
MTIAVRAVAEARRWIGTPYRHGGSSFQIGCDCLGLVRGVWRALYDREPEAVPAYSGDWAETGKGDPLIDAACRHMLAKDIAAITTGDLIIFRWRDGMAAKHLGIVTTPHHFVHAYEGHAVLESALVPQWRRRIAAVFAFPDHPMNRSGV